MSNVRQLAAVQGIECIQGASNCSRRVRWCIRWPRKLKPTAVLLGLHDQDHTQRHLWLLEGQRYSVEQSAVFVRSTCCGDLVRGMSISCTLALSILLPGVVAVENIRKGFYAMAMTIILPSREASHMQELGEHVWRPGRLTTH